MQINNFLLLSFLLLFLLHSNYSLLIKSPPKFLNQVKVDDNPKQDVNLFVDLGTSNRFNNKFTQLLYPKEKLLNNNQIQLNLDSYQKDEELKKVLGTEFIEKRSDKDELAILAAEIASQKTTNDNSIGKGREGNLNGKSNDTSETNGKVSGLLAKSKGEESGKAIEKAYSHLLKSNSIESKDSKVNSFNNTKKMEKSLEKEELLELSANEKLVENMENLAQSILKSSTEDLNLTQTKTVTTKVDGNSIPAEALE